MTVKRFNLICDSHLEWLMQSELFLPIRDKNTHRKISLRQCLDLLNELYNENEDLKTDISVLNRHYDEYEKVCAKLKEENKQLKKENKRLEKMNDILADILVDNGLV